MHLRGVRRGPQEKRARGSAPGAGGGGGRTRRSRAGTEAVGRRRLPPPPALPGAWLLPLQAGLSPRPQGRLVAKLGNIHIWGTGKREGPALAPNTGGGSSHDGAGSAGSAGGGRTDQQVGSSGVQRHKALPLGHHTRSKSRSLGSTGWQRQALKRNFSSTTLALDARTATDNAPTESVEEDKDADDRVSLDQTGTAGSVRPEDASAALHSGQSGAAFRASEGGDFAGKKEVAGATAAPVLTSSSERSALASAKTLVDTSEAHHVSLDAMTHTPQSKHAKQQSFKLTPGTRGHAGELDALAGDSKSDSASGATQDGASVSIDAAMMGRWRNRVIVGTIQNQRPQQPCARAPQLLDPVGKGSLAQAALPRQLCTYHFCDSVRNTRGQLPFDYWTMVRHTAVLMQRLCVVVIFSMCFAWRDRGRPV